MPAAAVGKKLLFVGDSLNMNMWESLVCVLRSNVVHKSCGVHEASGSIDFKRSCYYSFIYEKYNCFVKNKKIKNCSIDFVRSPFMLRKTRLNGCNGVEESLRLDMMDELTLI
ncbi:protein trichome birefringence-like protein 2 [Cinnamomum micranthum f. kanehirae]|uniref:Protein trichome birefringence-like protein 2 n=1 Tax=Cinnamomum micranthum f. kanehirae TaxID=337451 RepID=A0A443PTE9_9MAGN|nr:protein trichome birefringence-like protein 2 [Cinnamomum micranthum f. kanehirae]